MTKPPNDGEGYWLDDIRNVRKIVWALVFVCAGLFVADAFYHKHTFFRAEGWFGFYALYGFFMCVGLVLAAKVIRVFLMRDEDFYDKDSSDD
tara:strand:+ start:919 stop:1194 length:276 start_codon:yes stop_codon:yes gene_type:complete